MLNFMPYVFYAQEKNLGEHIIAVVTVRPSV
jgi:hypothetical protein